jgi:hypothetical protein
MHRNLPKPIEYPLHGCAKDPTFYTATKSLSSSGYTTTMLLFESGDPFVALYGFETDMRVVPLPDVPIHGYKFCPEVGRWVIAASGG